MPYAALGLGRDGANNLASSRLESWALDDSSVEQTPYSVLDSTKLSLVSGLFYWPLVSFIGLWSVLLCFRTRYTIAFHLLHTLINCDCLVYSVSQSGATVKLHVRARLFFLAR